MLNNHGKPTMKKTIVRNVEVPIKKSNKWSDNQKDNQKKCNQRANPTKSQEYSSKNYHDPKYNSLLEWKNKIDEVKEFVAKEKKLVNPNPEILMNKEVSKKLNFPPKQQLYKNLPSIYAEARTVEANKVLKDTHTKIRDSRNKSRSNEIDDMLKKLVSLEYEEKYLENKIPQTNHRYMPGEDDYLGLNKFRQMKLYHTSEKEDDEQFQQMNYNNCLIATSKSDEFDNFIPMHRRPPLGKINDYDCNCFEYYERKNGY